MEGGPEAHLTKGTPATLIRYASAERDLSIIPPVLCHMGFILGGIQSAATTNPEGLLLHTQIRTQTHQ